MTTTEARPQLPFERPNVMDIAPLYTVLNRQDAPVQVTTPAGDPAWMITRFEQARQLLGDTRLGRSHPAPEQASRVSDAVTLGGPSGEQDKEAANHTRMRKLLVPAFSAGRMRRLSDHVQTLVDGYLDEMAAQHEFGPVDLHAILSFPLPVRVLCELLGVPVEDREYFHDLSTRFSRMDLGVEAARGAWDELTEYFLRLVRAKLADPRPDVISDLALAQAEDPTFSDEELAAVGGGVLFAGHETTMTRIDMGVVFLTADLDRRDRFAADPDGQVQATVEEVLRITAPGALGQLRYAHEDIEVDGVTIRRGDCVLINTGVANRDPAVFSEPDTFDPGRNPNIHLGFGHGIHFCVGASLARTELRIALSTLFRRFPMLRMAIAPEDLQPRPGSVAGGLVSLPVTW
ncbi:cytochrome P450 [Kutzneria chonburiensis]|uniref:Cytochrome P450 n=1 Tax=Kutzneria chonburiensis TaxID=1483604 RepID=A0ABV6N0L4_9PSEU|nr:cytochrome P450 [Kutzneria chonburiensis]